MLVKKNLETKIIEPECINVNMIVIAKLIINDIRIYYKLHRHVEEIKEYKCEWLYKWSWISLNNSWDRCNIISSNIQDAIRGMQKYQNLYEIHAFDNLIDFYEYLGEELRN